MEEPIFMERITGKVVEHNFLMNTNVLLLRLMWMSSTKLPAGLLSDWISFKLGYDEFIANGLKE